MLTILFDGIAYGMLLFVLAVGLAVTLGLMNFVNLAHGAFAMVGGYACVLLDTLDDMESARALYADLGFEEIPPYYQSPIAGAHYLKVEID